MKKSSNRARATLRDLLVKARHDARLSQRDVAQRLGKHQSYVARYETGRRLNIIEFTAIAKALGRDPVRLLRKLLQMLE